MKPKVLRSKKSAESKEKAKMPEYTPDEVLAKELDREMEPIKYLLSAFIKQHYGPRCAVYQMGCDCCERWRAFDTIFHNYYKE